LRDDAPVEIAESAGEHRERVDALLAAVRNGLRISSRV